MLVVSWSFCKVQYDIVFTCWTIIIITENISYYIAFFILSCYSYIQHLLLQVCFNKIQFRSVRREVQMVTWQSFTNSLRPGKKSCSVNTHMDVIPVRMSQKKTKKMEINVILNVQISRKISISWPPFTAESPTVLVNEQEVKHTTHATLQHMLQRFLKELW